MSLKTAVTSLPINEVLQERWSPRAFNGQMIATDILQRMFEAARWSPSASNEQPWRFIVGIKGDGTYERLYEHFDEFNRLWTITAPVLIAAIAKTSSNRHPGKENVFALYDLGQAMAHISFQAASDGLHVHQLAGFDAGAIAKSFEVPEDYRVFTVMAAGYVGDPDQLHPKLKKMELAERVRQDIKDMVFEKRFGNTSHILL